jgi:Cytochrome P450
MSESASLEMSAAIPAHVPPELVKVFDFRTGLGDRPQEAIGKLAEGPPIFFSPVRHVHLPGGAWVVAHADLVKEVMNDPKTFSSAEQGSFLSIFGDDFLLAPLAADPPVHGRFRTLINPLFTPGKMIALSPKIKSWCNELLDRFAAKGRCNFINEFADHFPTGIFIDLMGLDRARLTEFVRWNQAFIHGETDEERFAGIQQVVNFFNGIYDQRDSQPEGTVAHYLLNATPDGKPLTRGEFVGTAFLVFSAGLDTVVSTLGFIFRALAEDQDLQAHLRANPQDLPRHVEEMMRLFSPVTPQRVATCDTVLAGVTIKKGDVLALSLTAASRDPAIFSDPMTLNAGRATNSHFGFGYGIHRCVGAHLARRDLVIALETWFARLPPFRLAADAKITASGGSVQTLDGLVLQWG